ncbi:MAG TPA: response regulator, partial [Leptospiraceae bacterium]|nr:response regulator [Leptospiraceae bacterium]
MEEKGFRILAVDDEQVNLNVLENQLSLEGWSVISAENGETAVHLVESSLPNLILLDVMMPKISGYEVCRIIRKKYTQAELPIIMLTAKNTENDL